MTPRVPCAVSLIPATCIRRRRDESGELVLERNSKGNHVGCGLSPTPYCMMQPVEWIVCLQADRRIFGKLTVSGGTVSYRDAPKRDR